jgi:hypothetical protein
VLAFGDTEVPVGELVLAHAVHRACCADGQHERGAAIGALRAVEDGDRASSRHRPEFRSANHTGPHGNTKQREVNKLNVLGKLFCYIRYIYI